MENNVTRKFIIGSEWLSYKLYMGTKTADNFIKSELIEITDTLSERKYIDSWFFIRYYDTDFHLRIRFHLIDTTNIGNVIEFIYRITNKFIKNKLIHKVVVDSYSRELERYGVNTIKLAENLFCANSKTIIDVLSIVDEDGEARWLLGIKTIDILLDGFDYSLKEKRDLLFELKVDFGNEFGMNKYLRKQLSLKFRNNRNNIEEIIENENFSTLNKSQIEYEKIYHCFLKEEEGKYSIRRNIDTLMYSFIHMHCNRLFSSKNRMNEWVLYDLLHQYYYSSFARHSKRKLNSTKDDNYNIFI